MPGTACVVAGLDSNPAAVTCRPAAEVLPGTHPHRNQLLPGARIDIMVNLAHVMTRKVQAFRLPATVDAVLGPARKDAKDPSRYLVPVSIKDLTYVGNTGTWYEPLDCSEVLLRLDKPRAGRCKGYWWLLEPVIQSTAAAAAGGAAAGQPTEGPAPADKPVPEVNAAAQPPMLAQLAAGFVGVNAAHLEDSTDTAPMPACAAATAPSSTTAVEAALAAQLEVVAATEASESAVCTPEAPYIDKHAGNCSDNLVALNHLQHMASCNGEGKCTASAAHCAVIDGPGPGGNVLLQQKSSSREATSAPTSSNVNHAARSSGMLNLAGGWLLQQQRQCAPLQRGQQQLQVAGLQQQRKQCATHTAMDHDIKANSGTGDVAMTVPQQVFTAGDADVEVAAAATALQLVYAAACSGSVCATTNISPCSSACVFAAAEAVDSAAAPAAAAAAAAHVLADQPNLQPGAVGMHAEHVDITMTPAETSIGQATRLEQLAATAVAASPIEPAVRHVSRRSLAFKKQDLGSSAPSRQADVQQQHGSRKRPAAGIAGQAVSRARKLRQLHAHSKDSMQRQRQQQQQQEEQHQSGQVPEWFIAWHMRCKGRGTGRWQQQGQQQMQQQAAGNDRCENSLSFDNNLSSDDLPCWGMKRQRTTWQGDAASNTAAAAANQRMERGAWAGAAALRTAGVAVYDELVGNGAVISAAASPAATAALFQSASSSKLGSGLSFRPNCSLCKKLKVGGCGTERAHRRCLRRPSFLHSVSITKQQQPHMRQQGVHRNSAARRSNSSGGRTGGDGEAQGVESSHYRGVSLDRRKHRWRVQIKVAALGNSGVSVGYFKTEVAAARAYDRAAISLLGRHCCRAYLNFPVSEYDLDSLPHLVGKSREEIKQVRGGRASMPRSRPSSRGRSISVPISSRQQKHQQQGQQRRQEQQQQDQQQQQEQLQQQRQGHAAAVQTRRQRPGTRVEVANSSQKKDSSSAAADDDVLTAPHSAAASPPAGAAAGAAGAEPAAAVVNALLPGAAVLPSPFTKRTSSLEPETACAVCTKLMKGDYGTEQSQLSQDQAQAQSQQEQQQQQSAERQQLLHVQQQAAQQHQQQGQQQQQPIAEQQQQAEQQHAEQQHHYQEAGTAWQQQQPQQGTCEGHQTAATSIIATLQSKMQQQFSTQLPVSTGSNGGKNSWAASAPDMVAAITAAVTTPAVGRGTAETSITNSKVAVMQPQPVLGVSAAATTETERPAAAAPVSGCPPSRAAAAAAAVQPVDQTIHMVARMLEGVQGIQQHMHSCAGFLGDLQNSMAAIEITGMPNSAAVTTVQEAATANGLIDLTGEGTCVRGSYNLFVTAKQGLQDCLLAVEAVSKQTSSIVSARQQQLVMCFKCSTGTADMQHQQQQQLAPMCSKLLNMFLGMRKQFGDMAAATAAALSVRAQQVAAAAAVETKSEPCHAAAAAIRREASLVSAVSASLAAAFEQVCSAVQLAEHLA